MVKQGKMRIIDAVQEGSSYLPLNPEVCMRLPAGPYHRAERVGGDAMVTPRVDRATSAGDRAIRRFGSAARATNDKELP
jgi:hypothetical protein